MAPRIVATKCGGWYTLGMRGKPLAAQSPRRAPSRAAPVDNSMAGRLIELIEGMTQLSQAMLELAARMAHPVVPAPTEQQTARAMQRAVNDLWLQQVMERQAIQQAQAAQQLPEEPQRAARLVPRGTPNRGLESAQYTPDGPMDWEEEDRMERQAQAAARYGHQGNGHAEGPDHNDDYVNAAYEDEEPSAPSALHQQMLDELQEYGEEEDEPPPPLDADTVWRQRLSVYAQMRLWMTQDWGPEPGKQGCRVPPHLIPRSRRG